MRREDIGLRLAARHGDPQACMEVARRLFEGGVPGFGRNATLGIAYLQPLLARGRPDALALVARCVPLETIVTHRLQDALVRGAEEDCPASLLKLGILFALDRARRAEALPLLRLAGHFANGLEPGLLDDAERFAAELATLPVDVLVPARVALLCAREALQSEDLATACHCIRIAAALAPADAVDEIVAKAVRLASVASSRLDLPVALVESSLRERSRHGDADAQYALGCALAGIPYGHLEPRQVARQQCASRATGWLLRAADAGKHAAWLDLFHVLPGARAAIAAHDVARFFLEKAARSGLVEAQARLGTLLLAEATCMRTAEDAMQWLAAAADAGVHDATEVLRTLVLPLPELPADYEQQLLEKCAALDRDVGMRMELARALHLTRQEALGFSSARDLRPWGLALPGTSKENPKGRLAPAVGAHMKAVLERARAFYAAASALDGSMALQRARAHKHIFTLLGVRDADFFAGSLGRSWTHYGYGRHWATRWGKKAAHLPREFLARLHALSPRANEVQLS
jgi:TPR repeat protein